MTKTENDGLWYVKLARDSLNEGHRVIAHHLNLVLQQKTPEVRIGADLMLEGDSLRHAAKQFHGALPALRTQASLPHLDSHVNIWTLGFVNDTGNLQCMVSVNGINSVDFNLELYLDVLRNRDWKPEHWREFIQAPVTEHYSNVLAYLQDIEAVKATGTEFSPGKNKIHRTTMILPPSPDERRNDD